MSMVINLVEDHNIYLCEGGPVYNGGVPAPPPVIYLLTDSENNILVDSGNYQLTVQS
jgi:hypothetical protein